MKPRDPKKLMRKRTRKSLNIRTSTKTWTRRLIGICLSLSAVFLYALSTEASEPMEKLRNLRVQARWSDLLKEAQRLQSSMDKPKKASEPAAAESAFTETVPSELRWANFFAFLAQKHLGNIDLALKELQKLNRNEDSLRELALLEMGHLWLAQKNWSAAKKILLELQNQQPNLRMSVQARLGLAQAHLGLGENKAALALLQKLERQQKRQEMHPEILWLLAQSQKNIKSQVAFCQSLRKLYSQYPSFPEIQTWSLDLSKDLFLDQPTRCATNFEDRRSRIRSLQWAGLSEKARQELSILKIQTSKDEAFEMDRLQIHFLLHEGEVVEALEILRKYRDTHFHSPVFQSLFGLVAARLGLRRHGPCGGLRVKAGLL
ncbi:MAG: tetratricopeptide repeat protein [Bdellovibrio sp.]